jgi:flagellar motor switch protein FliN/FliY
MRIDLQRVLSLDVPLIVVLGERQMRLSEVVALQPGTIIELPKKADEELELRANNKPIATGVAVKVGENFGLRVTFIGDLKERIGALGETAAAGEKDEE